MVPPDHLVRQIDDVLDLSWVHKELAPYYSHTGRPSIDPVLMIRMLMVGYVFAIRSERRLCAEVQVNSGVSERPRKGPLFSLPHPPGGSSFSSGCSSAAKRLSMAFARV